MAQAVNNAAVTFPNPTGAAWADVTHFAINDQASGGNRKIAAALTGDPDPAAVGQLVQFSAGALTISHTTGDATESGRQDMLRGLLMGTRYVSLHTGVPSNSNELSGNGYARGSIALAGWTIS